MSAGIFHPSVARWFSSAFSGATPVQTRAWDAIASGNDTLISAPTGSGKTLAGFLAVIDRLVRRSLDGTLRDETQILYVSPLKALSNDIDKNLQGPLNGIRAELAADMLGDAPVRTAVRTGDTPQSERARMRRIAPHILVTTPESLYILLTSGSGRQMLSSVETVIVDEIHAVAGTKRGAHLALSLERLANLCPKPPARIGISATTKPIERMAAFLCGRDDNDCVIVDEGHVRERDIALELPGSTLEALMSNEVWTEIYDRLAELIREHRTTLIFVNTRRLAERAARALAERFDDSLVTSHHGSLAREHRLAAERRLKAGELKALVATASLELGIDIGDVDLVCQLGSPRGIATFLQRVGRSGHGLGRLPKGRLFPLSRDELVESTALLESVRIGELDAVLTQGPAVDVLAQQIVAEAGMQETSVDALFELVRRAWPYRTLERSVFDNVVRMLAEGFTTHRGRRAAHIHLDRVNGVIRGRRSARLTAITNGGSIPDQFDYEVVLMPNEFPIGTLNEDFAFESLPGDIFQLGNTSYRILRVVSGKVFVEDAKGQPPNIPFWFGEAPGRSDELSASVARLRERVDSALETAGPESVAARLVDELGLSLSAASQLVEYLAAAKAAFGNLPTSERIVFERFFDETGDTHLVIHSPYGSRINRAWGLALRKRFCRRFNFELQAAALEDTIILSLGAVHSFALEEVASYLSSKSVRGVLEQAVLGAPIFPTHWRWNSTIALAVRRFYNGRKAPAQFQRTDAEDLLSTVFPEQLACAENLGGGDRQIPDHPLVAQTLTDCLEVAMDIGGLERLLARIEAGQVRIECRELASPSPLAQEVLTAKAYAFLDDAPAEERRTLAVQSRRYMSVEEAADLGRLDGEAIERVRREAWPEARDADEMHDALVVLGFVSPAEAVRDGRWPSYLELLRRDRRATLFEITPEHAVWVSAERLHELESLFPEGRAADAGIALEPATVSVEDALVALIRSRLESLGPVTIAALAQPLGLDAGRIELAMLALEQQGTAMRGSFSGPGVSEWCERRLLARIHRYTLKRLRSEIEPVTLAQFQRFVFQWQGFGDEQREGREGLAAVLAQLQGMSLPAIVWERAVLPARVAHYGGDLLDALSVSGEVAWWRARPSSGLGKIGTVAASPIALLPRAHWMHWRLLSGSLDDESEARCSSHASAILEVLERRGALFFLELVQQSGLLRVQAEDALGELVARGLVTADSFNGLRALIKPSGKRSRYSRRGATSAFDSAGRWAVVGAVAPDDSPDARANAVEHAALVLLRRYGVMARALLQREALAPGWRELLQVYRRAEARGEIRGGRFVDAFPGEQFALPEAVERLRLVRREGAKGDWLIASAADPANLSGLVSSSVPMIASNRMAWLDGIVVAAVTSRGFEGVGDPSPDVLAEARRRLMPADHLRTRGLRGRTA